MELGRGTLLLAVLCLSLPSCLEAYVTNVCASEYCCSDTSRCMLGQGDCDEHVECGLGLHCGVDNCLQDTDGDMDCCKTKDCRLGPVGSTRPDWECCSSSSPCLEAGEGDCDSDSDCGSGLRCGYNNCGPNDPTGVMDCCTEQPDCRQGSSWLDWRCCTPTHPCGEGQGDCNEDSACTGDLVCGQDNCGKMGRPESHWRMDCCTRPDIANSPYLSVDNTTAQSYRGDTTRTQSYREPTKQSHKEPTTTTRSYTVPPPTTTQLYTEPTTQLYTEPTTTTQLYTEPTTTTQLYTEPTTTTPLYTEPITTTPSYTEPTTTTPSYTKPTTTTQLYTEPTTTTELYTVPTTATQSYTQPTTRPKYTTRTTPTEYATENTTTEYAIESTRTEYATDRTTTEYATEETTTEYATLKTTTEYATEMTRPQYNRQETTTEYATEMTTQEYAKEETTTNYANEETTPEYANKATTAPSADRFCPSEKPVLFSVCDLLDATATCNYGQRLCCGGQPMGYLWQMFCHSDMGIWVGYTSGPCPTDCSQDRPQRRGQRGEAPIKPTQSPTTSVRCQSGSYPMCGDDLRNYANECQVLAAGAEPACYGQCPCTV